MATSLLVIIYVAFVSLGLPDAMLGAAWPVMQGDFGVPYGLAGLVSMTGSAMTILSSILSSRVLRTFGVGRVTAVSVGMTAVALAGFGLIPGFWWLLLAAIPLGLGAGSVDSGLNAFVAEHYESRHMSWLHSFWGVGALSGPLLLAGLLGLGASWRWTYLGIAAFQAVLVVILVRALPLWKKTPSQLVAGDTAPSSVPHAPEEHRPLFFPLKVPGVKVALMAFFFYCGIEASMGLWGGSYLFKMRGMDSTAAAGAVSAFFASLTAGRFITGFVTYRMSNKDLIRWGGILVLAGAALMVVPLPLPLTLAGFLMIGMGCAPIFPCMLHETPARFGRRDAPAIMGFQMAVAYVGSTLLPPLFGAVASWTSLALLPAFGLIYALGLVGSSEWLRHRTDKKVSVPATSGLEGLEPGSD